MEVGIIGLPYSGKTILFSTLTGQEVTASHISGRVEAHRGVVTVPDGRMDKLAAIFQPQKIVYTTIEYLEVGGLEKEAAHGKGFDPQFLGVLKTTTALCLILRAFENEDFPHPEGSVDPQRDLQIVETEFILSDLGIVENRIDRLKHQIQKAKTDEDIRELELMKRCCEYLENEKPLREMKFSEDEYRKIRGYQFLSAKPLLVVVNCQEECIATERETLAPFDSYQVKPNVLFTALSAEVEYEISQLEEEERKPFLQDLQIEESAVNKLIRKCYDLLGLITFFTYHSNECRAWTAPRNTNIRKAAGTIHSDMERGFIRAEVVNYKDFIEAESIAKCREKGVLRLEGKDYVVQDGDLVMIRFNV